MVGTQGMTLFRRMFYVIFFAYTAALFWLLLEDGLLAAFLSCASLVLWFCVVTHSIKRVSTPTSEVSQYLWFGVAVDSLVLVGGLILTVLWIGMLFTAPYVQPLYIIQHLIGGHFKLVSNGMFSSNPTLIGFGVGTLFWSVVGAASGYLFYLIRSIARRGVPLPKPGFLGFVLIIAIYFFIGLMSSTVVDALQLKFLY